MICDSGDHASILDGCRLSGAKLRPFRHNRMDKLEKMLGRAAEDGGGVLVVVDGVFSMEGDVCDLPRTVELCRAHGARLLVDEAHGAGVLGRRGAGACELFGLEDEVDLRMGTFSKSLASCGGFIAGPADVVEYLRISSRSFVFSASAVPAAVGAALAALRVIRSDGPALFEKLLANAEYLREGLRGLGLQVVEPGSLADGSVVTTPVVPVDRRRRLAGGPALEGAVREGRLHQRRDPPRGPARRRAAADEPDGDPRDRAPRRRARDRSAGSSRTSPISRGPENRSSVCSYPSRGSFGLVQNRTRSGRAEKLLLLANVGGQFAEPGLTLSTGRNTLAPLVATSRGREAAEDTLDATGEGQAGRGRYPSFSHPREGALVNSAAIAPASTTATAPQHMQALARANRVRLARAELKRSIARGEVDVAGVIEESPWETESMTLAELLTSQRRWGRTRARKFLQGLALNENKRLGTLTSRQRSLLAGALLAKSGPRDSIFA